MAMTKTKTDRLRNAVDALRAEQVKAGDGHTPAMQRMVAAIERVLISEALEPDLVPWNAPPDKDTAKCLIRTWRDADGKDVAEARHVTLILCRCAAALIAADSILPKKPGRPPKDKEGD